MTQPEACKVLLVIRDSMKLLTPKVQKVCIELLIARLLIALPEVDWEAVADNTESLRDLVPIIREAK